MASLSSNTVKFNVGGTRYEVSRSLLERYPSSMLTKISSETWQEGATVTSVTERGSNEIYIDRNGERFQYVLDYMRDARVELPLSVPKRQLIADLEYFALDYNDKCIYLSVSDPNDLFHTLGRYRDFFAEKSAEMERCFREAAAEKLACDIAQEYFSKLVHDKSPTNIYGQTPQESLSYFQSARIMVHDSTGQGDHLRHTELNRYIRSYGLTLDSFRKCGTNIEANVSLI